MAETNYTTQGLRFEEKLQYMVNEKREDNSYSLFEEKYEAIILDMKDILLKQPKSKQDYRRMKKYQIFSVSEIEKLI